MTWRRFRALGMALGLLATTLSPMTGIAQEASPAADSPTVAFCGLQDGGGLDRSMTQFELDTYFGGGLPTYSWYPSERGCAADTPFVTFDEAGAFLGFVEPDAPLEEPLQEAAQPAQPEAPTDGGDPVADPETVAPPTDDPASAAPATPAVEAPQDAVEPAATSIPEPTPTPTAAETWTSREGKIAVCLQAFETPVYTEWMTPEEYEQLAAAWVEAGNSGELSPYGLTDIVGLGDMTNFGACTTENGVLKSQDASVICRTVGPNGERIPVYLIPHYSSRSHFRWEDVPDVTGRCPGDPRWSEIGERVDVSWMSYAPIGAPQEMVEAEAARIAEIHRLQESGEIGDFYFPPNDADAWTSETTLGLYEHNVDGPGLNPVCIDHPWGVRTNWLSDAEAADLAAEAAAVARSGVSRDGVITILGPGDPSNHNSCATENGVLKPFDSAVFEVVCRATMDDAEVWVAYPELVRIDQRWKSALDAVPDPVTGACPPVDPGYEPGRRVYDAPALPEDVIVYGGI